MAQSFERLLRADPGFEPGGVLTLRVPVPTFRYPDVAATTTLHGRIQSALAALPGVAAVGATSVLPLSGAAAVSSVVFAGAPGNTGDSEHDLPSVDVFTTRPGYFDALGIAILAGRGFDAVPPDGRREVVIDRTLATTLFPDSTPVGRTMRNSGGELTVIGVVEHARLHDVLADGRSQIFVRSDDPERRLAGTLSWALRTDRPPLALGPEVRAAIGSIDPQLAVTNIRSMDRVVSDSLSQQRLSAVLLTGFALTALVLAAMGLFGVVSGSVTRRRHEIAVRLALGAEHSQLVRFVLREGALLVLIGLLVGAPGSYLAIQVLRGMLVGVSPLDTLTFGVVAVGLTLVALMACYVPARRVAGIDPARTLQAD